MSFFLLFAAWYVSGEVFDRWDIYSGTDPAHGDEAAAWLTIGLLVAAFVAWAVERIADAINGDR